MPESPYRRPGAPSREKPRGVVVSRADAPPDTRVHEKRGKREQVLDAIALEEAAARRSRLVRIAGVVGILFGLLLCALTMSDLANGIESHPAKIVRLSSISLFVGAWFAGVGLGGSSDGHRVPPWVTVGALIAGVLGAVWGGQWHLDLLAHLVGY